MSRSSVSKRTVCIGWEKVFILTENINEIVVHSIYIAILN